MLRNFTDFLLAPKELIVLEYDGTAYEVEFVDSEGRTVRVYKETYDPNGNLVHVKEK